MICRQLLPCLFLAAVFAAPQPVSAAPPRTVNRTPATPVSMRAARREAIRRMPLLARPDRPGHFYGNTVRRLHRRRVHGR